MAQDFKLSYANQSTQKCYYHYHIDHQEVPLALLLCYPLLFFLYILDCVVVVSAASYYYTVAIVAIDVDAAVIVVALHLSSSLSFSLNYYLLLFTLCLSSIGLAL